MATILNNHSRQNISRPPIGRGISAQNTPIIRVPAIGNPAGRKPTFNPYTMDVAYVGGQHTVPNPAVTILREK